MHRTGADPASTAYKRKSLTPLMVAVINNDNSAELVNLLIKHGADLNTAGPKGTTAFHIACDMGFEECASQ